MAIIPQLGKAAKQNLELVYSSLKKAGITNKFTQAGILAVCAKESGFTLRAEYDYSTTGTARIRQIFGMSEFTDRQIDALKKDPVQWFDYLYGGKYENSTANREFKALGGKVLPRSEGYKYRGRGFNQVTFKTLYRQLLPYAGGKDIVKDPDLLLDPNVAAPVLVGFFVKNFKDFPNILRAWNMKDKNDAKNLEEGVGVPFHLTGGVGYTREQVVALGNRIGSWPKSKEYAKEFYDWILKKEGEKPDPAAYQTTEPTPTTPVGGTPSATASAAAEGDSQSRESRGASDSGSSTSNTVDNSAPNIRTIVEAKIKARKISFDLPPQKDQQKEIALNFGKIPIIWYNAYQIKPGDIRYISLSTIDGIPTLRVTFLDTYNLMKDKAFPLDDTKISIFINTMSENLKPIHLDFKISRFNVDGKIYDVTGVLDVSQLYIKKFRSISKKTSFNALKTIAEEVGLGFNSNIDDTNDEMTWINTGEWLYKFIEKIVDRSYKSDEAFLVSYLDYYYGLNYVEVEKELNRDIKGDLGIPSIGLAEIAKVKDKDKVARLFLTNDQSLKDSNSYFNTYRILNLSTSVSLEEGYLTKVKFYDEIQKNFLIFDVDSISSKGDTTIILKGNPQDESFYNENANLIYKGKLDIDNMHQNFIYSSVQNERNIVDLEKIGMELTMGHPNYNLIKFQKVHIILSNQHSTPSASHINNRLSGEWLIIDIYYIFDGKKYDQKIKLIKRELELSAEELKKEGSSPGKSSNQNQGERTANENPTTTNEQGTTQSSTTQQTTTQGTTQSSTTQQTTAPEVKSNTPAIIPQLGKAAKENLELVYQSLKKAGINNKFTQAGILAVCAKESGFTLRAELDYSTTPITQIRKVFGLSEFTDRQIDALKKDPVQWFDYLYGGKYENSTANREFKALGGKVLPRSEGYKYRGRGFNQVTFKSLYRQLLPYAEGKDIVKDPDLLLDPKVAAPVLVGFFLKNFRDFPNILKAWNMNNKDDAKNLEEGVGVPFHLTGGVGYTREQVVALGNRIGSWPKSKDYAKEFYEWILKKEGNK